MRYSSATIERFWKKVDRREPDECWPWLGGLGNKGYGKIKLQGTRIDVQAHLMAFELANGLLPSGKVVCHTCDNPPCCNSRHLWAGTHRDNQLDMISKGRQRSGASDRWGTRNPRAKLTDEQLLLVRRMINGGLGNTEIAKSFPVTHHTISLIRLGKRYGR